MQDRFDRKGVQTDGPVGDAVAVDFGVAGEEVRDCGGAGDSVEGALVGVRGRRAEVDCAGGWREHGGAGRCRGGHCGRWVWRVRG